jgi:hypothetical protein
MHVSATRKFCRTITTTTAHMLLTFEIVHHLIVSGAAASPSHGCKSLFNMIADDQKTLALD